MGDFKREKIDCKIELRIKENSEIEKKIVALRQSLDLENDSISNVSLTFRKAVQYILFTQGIKLSFFRSYSKMKKQNVG
jgi:hypothetical protein